MKSERPHDLVPEKSIQTDRPAPAAHANLSLLLPLSGPNAEIGRQFWDAAVLALFDGGRDDLVLMPHDTQGTPAGAIAAAEAAVRSGTNAVVGPLFSSSVSAAKPILAASGTRGIALSNNRAVAGAPFFLIGNHPETQVDALTSYLGVIGRKRIVLFGPDTPYLQLLRERLSLLDEEGKIRLVDTRLYRSGASYTEISKDVRALTIYDRRAAALKEFTAIFSESWQSRENAEEAMQAALDRLSNRMERARMQLASYSPDARIDRKSWIVTDAEYSVAKSDLLQLYHKQLRAGKSPREAMQEAVSEFQLRETLGQVDFDAVLLPVGDEPLLVIAPMFEYFNASQPNVWLLGTDVWESAARQLPKDLQGGRYVTATSRQWKGFETRFAATFGHAPDPLAATAYDAVRVAITEMQDNGHLSFEESFVTRQAGFDGVNGRFRFLNGGSNERTLQIVELRRDGAADVFTWEPDQQMVSPQIAPAGPAAQPIHSVPPVSSLDALGGGNS